MATSKRRKKQKIIAAELKKEKLDLLLKKWFSGAITIMESLTQWVK